MLSVSTVRYQPAGFLFLFSVSVCVCLCVWVSVCVCVSACYHPLEPPTGFAHCFFFYLLRSMLHCYWLLLGLSLIQPERYAIINWTKWPSINSLWTMTEPRSIEIGFDLGQFQSIATWLIDWLNRLKLSAFRLHEAKTKQNGGLFIESTVNWSV